MNDVINSLFSLTGKTIILTGASRGIGERLALGLKSAGCNLICISRSKKPDEPELDENYIECDVLNQDKFRQICRDAFGKFGKIHALVNVAGVSMPRIPGQEREQFSQTLRINLEGVYQCCGTAYEIMENNGAILNVGSIGGFLGFPNNPGYIASKGGVRMLSKALAVDFAEKGIRVNCLSPGYIKTSMTAKSYNNEEQRNARTERTILKRWGTSDDLIGAAIFLVSDASAYVTGADLIVDGGWTAKGL
jgi:gluconate 5-dehydrogenase